MGATEIALLGPLSVNGDSAVLSPRDRVVLTALAIRPGEVASAERLADALWGEHPPASWHKVVPGCILRLRRVLGADAIETTPYGYRLAVAPDEVDVHRFQRLLQRGRELLTLGEPERAQNTLDEALALWRGRPLIDVERWEPGRIESDRLAELHLQTVECRVDAALRAGRHDEVLALAQSAVAEAPLRERRWAMLALAQYQTGRQGEALSTLHHARTVLATELGLDPGPDLAALEAAILRQDPALTVQPAGPEAVAHCPYLGLFCYEITAADTFFGRDKEVAECLGRLDSVGMLAVVGPSGSGKSSLIRAGVAAALERAGRHPLVVTAGSRPTMVLTNTPSMDTVLVVDQFEEVFTQCTDQQERIRFFDALVAQAGCSPVVICMRADHLGALAEYPEIARLVERGVYLLGPMNVAGLRAAITGPAVSAGLLLEPGLVDLLIREVEGQPGALPLLSHALRRTWERRDGRTMTVAGYQATGGIRGCVAQSAEQLYESLTTRQRQLLRQVLLRLVSAASEGDPVRIRVPHRVLLTDPERERLVEQLVAARLVTADGEAVQIAHESLAVAWPRLSNWLDEDVEGQRIMRHLSASADAWETMGRPDSELYRGARLTNALQWLRTAHPDLTVTESDFIDASGTVSDAEHRAIEQQARLQVRTRRRTRLLTTGLAALLVAALTGGLLAVRQQHQREVADAAAVIAEASRIDGAAHNARDVDHALLLALEANRLHDSPDTRAVVADLLSGHPALIRSVSTAEAVQTLAVSPDGRTLMVGEGDSGTAVYSTDTLQLASFYPAVTAWTIDYRPDGQQLLLVGRGPGGLGEDVNQVSAAVTDPQISALRYLKISMHGKWVYARDAAYSADGRFLTTYAQGDDDHSDIVDSAMVVWNAADLDQPITTVRPMPAFAVALSPDGRTLYVGTREPSITVVDVATGSVVNSVPLPPAIALVPTPADEDNIWTALSDAMEISPDGKTLAVAERNEVALYDSTTLTELRRLRGHNDLVRSLQFSSDGSLLASGSADHTAIVWDTARGAIAHSLIGHADTVLGLAFSPDDDTLYTGGLDRHLLVWDLTGRRQLAARIVDGESRTSFAGAAVPSPDGKAVVYAGATANGENLRFRDVTTGQLTDPVVDPGGGPLAAWLPTDDHRVVTVAGPDLRVRDRRNSRLVNERSVAPSNITALAATQDGGFVIVGDDSAGVERMESSTLASAGRRVQLTSPVTAVAAGLGDTAVALLDEQSYALVNLGEGTVLKSGTLPIKPAAAAVSPDGHRLAVGGNSGEVGLLDLDSQQWIAAPMAAHLQFVRGVAFSADGNTIVTSSFDGGVRLWDGTSGERYAGLQVGQGESPAVATLPPDERNAIIATRDGAVYRLDTRFDHWIAFACTLAGRNLTTQEWQAAFGEQPFHATCPVG